MGKTTAEMSRDEIYIKPIVNIAEFAFITDMHQFTFMFLETK